MRTPYRVPVNVRYINDGATVNNWTAISLDQVKTLTRRSAKEGVATPSLANTILFLKFVLFQYTSSNKFANFFQLDIRGKPKYDGIEDGCRFGL